MSIYTNQKHAYLIMAHNNFEQLRTLISLIDDVRNDLYLHIDKKVTNFPYETIKTEHAKLFLVDPISVTWGGHSQIQCEMLLFENAAPKHYMYYHVLSGVDLPLKTQDEIHTFFQSNAGKNFISYDEEALETRNFVSRTQYYHFFQNITGRNPALLMRMLRKLDEKAVRLQAILHMTRKEILPLYKGANWVSITDEMVQHILNCKKIIRTQFYYSLCGDEVFLQSIAMQSPYRNTIVDNSYRAVDWERGQPYTYRKEDVPHLLASPNLFARKFDSTVDAEAISLIVKHLSNENTK